MKKLMLSTALAAMLCGFSTFAAGPERKLTDEQLLASAVNEKSPEKRAGIALEVLKNNPADKAAMPMLLIASGELVPGTPQFREIALKMLDIAAKHPQDIAFVTNALRFAENARIRREARNAILASAVNAHEYPSALAEADRLNYYMLFMVYSAQEAAARRFDDNAERYMRLLEADPDSPMLRQSALRFFGKAAKFAPDSRRWLGLRQSERSEYAEYLSGLLARCNAGNDEEKLLALPFFIDSGDFNKAEELFELELAKSDANAFQKNFARGRFAAQIGDYPKAMKYAEEIISAQPPEQLGNLLEIFSEWAGRAGDEQRAIELADKALAVNPEAVLAAFNKSMALLKLGRYAEAAQAAVAMEPGLKLHIDVLALAAQGKNSEAVELLDSYAAGNPGELDADFYRLYVIPAERGRLAGPILKVHEYFSEKGLFEQPGNANDVGYVMASLGIALEEASRLIEYAVSEEPDNSAFLDSLAWVRFQQGRLAEARKYIELALENLKPSDDADSHFELNKHAGDIALAGGDKDAAKAYYAKALKIKTSVLVDRSGTQKNFDKLKSGDGK